MLGPVWVPLASTTSVLLCGGGGVERGWCLGGGGLAHCWVLKHQGCMSLESLCVCVCLFGGGCGRGGVGVCGVVFLVVPPLSHVPWLVCGGLVGLLFEICIVDASIN